MSAVDAKYAYAGDDPINNTDPTGSSVLTTFPSYYAYVGLGLFAIQTAAFLVVGGIAVGGAPVTVLAIVGSVIVVAVAGYLICEELLSE